MAFTQLITTQELESILEQPNLVILDASIPPVGGINPSKYSWPEVSIAKTRRFDLKKDFSDPEGAFPYTLPEKEHFQAAARKLGINDSSQIVIYDDIGLYSAARAWWMFKAMGHQNVAVLNGGLPKWLAEGREVTQADSSAAMVGDFIAQPIEHHFCNAEDVLNSINIDQTLIVDARAQARFSGELAEPRPGLRSGHIPNSVNLPFQRLIADGCLRPVEELVPIFNDIAQKQHQLIFSCGSGITACILALAADVCQYQDLIVYDGSWAEWGSTPDLPIVTFKQ